MPARLTKDYYKILELPPASKAEEIKKAYRALAFRYHPDTNPDNQYAASHFIEIQEAYSVLSDAERRRQYDEDRWLSGMSNRTRDQLVITPAWIYKEAQRLSRHMATIDTYRMSHSALYDYVSLLLQDTHMSIIQQANDAQINAAIVKELLHSTRHLKYQYMQPIVNRLVQMVPADNELLHLVHKQQQHSKRQALWQQYQPVVIALITLGLCIIMYLYSKQ